MNKVKQIHSDVRFDVDYEGYNFHMTFNDDCKYLYSIDDVTIDSDFGEKYPSTSEERVKFMRELEEFVRDKIHNDKSIWID